MKIKAEKSSILAECKNCHHRFLTTIKLKDSICPICERVGDCDYVQEDNLNILNEVSDIINGERQDRYGAPEDSFKIIAGFWTTYLGHKDIIIEGSLGISALDVAHMMTLFKIARMLGQRSDRDNYRDAIGYLAIAADRLS